MGRGVWLQTHQKGLRMARADDPDLGLSSANLWGEGGTMIRRREIWRNEVVDTVQQDRTEGNAIRIIKIKLLHAFFFFTSVTK